MSAGVATRPRYPLGLPAGSIRSILSILVIGMFCGMFLIPQEETERTVLPVLKDGYMVIPPYLVGLVGLIVISFLAGHGRSFNRGRSVERGSLGLPRLTVPLLLIAALVGTFLSKANTDMDGLMGQITASLEAYAEAPWTVIWAITGLLGGYMFGYIVQTIFGLDNQNVLYQDLIAWLSILAVVGVFILGMIGLIINVSIHEQAPLDLTGFGTGLAVMIAFYFAVRS